MLIVIGIILLDRFSKLLAIDILRTLDTVPIIKNVFHLTYMENTGAAFSIFSQNTNLLKIISTVAIIFMFLLINTFKDKSYSIYYQSFLAMIIGGAIGNLIDRIQYGFVIDYFDFRLIDFAVFNVADSFISVGAVLLGILIIFIDKSDRKIKE
jgi:signal peptidase II